MLTWTENIFIVVLSIVVTAVIFGAVEFYQWVHGISC